MPLYDFDCGTHRFERRVNMGEEAATCHECGETGRRVWAASLSQTRRWASEFHMPAVMRSTLDEATGYKHEAIAAKQEAEANGFRGV